MPLKSYKFIRPNPEELLIVKSKVNALLTFLFLTGFAAAWYGILLFQVEGGDNLNLWERLSKLVSEQPFMWIFLLAPLAFLIPRMFLTAKVILLGETFHFDKMRHVLSKNSLRLTSFEDIEKIRIKTYRNSDNYKSYGLHLVLKNGKKIKIISAKNLETVSDLADDIAAMANIKAIDQA